MRLIIISNRLPITINVEGENINYLQSIGGMATGISSYTTSILMGNTVFEDYLWVGWPGTSIEEHLHKEVEETCLTKYKYIPVFLNQSLIEHYYNKVCNNLLWPILHGFSQVADAWNEESWKSYYNANTVFWETVSKFIQPDDKIWIQDFHLFALPGLIRKSHPKISINFFLHTPFPSQENFNFIPLYAQIKLFKKLLGSSSICFHTETYANAFIKYIEAVCNVYSKDRVIIINKRKINIGAFAMGINYKEIKRLTSSKNLQILKQYISKKDSLQKSIISVDRLDYTKGIVNKLIAFERFLILFPDWKQKVVLNLFVAPSREGSVHFLKIKNEIETWVNDINRRQKMETWLPIHYEYKQLNAIEIFSLFKSSEVGLIMPIIDGMNLIAKKYIASNPYSKGTLILSNKAGASIELAEALLVDPLNIQEIAEAINKALNLKKTEIVNINTILHQKLKQNDILKWATDVLNFFE